MKSIALISLGCPRNFVDSERILALLGSHGYIIASDPYEADYLLVNTCGFIAPAVKESYEVIAELAEIKRRTGAKLIVCGCLSQRIPDQLFLEEEIDAVVGPDMLDHLVEIIAETERGKRSFSVRKKVCFDLRPQPRLLLSLPSAVLKVNEGCDNHCSYCTLPMIRGPLQSVPEQELLQEAEELASSGVKELILAGQDSTAYGIDLGKKDGLAELLKKLSSFGFQWIRIMYAHPARITDRLLDVMANTSGVCRYLDLPIQHVHPDILRAMGRPSLDYRILITRIRKAVPGIALRTTLITGFPGETEAHFAFLLNFVQEALFERLGVFPYYREEGTPAFTMPYQVPVKVRKARASKIMAAQKEISARYMASLIGRRLQVLVEKKGSRTSTARSEFDAPEIDCVVMLQGVHLPGTFLSAKVTKSSSYRLFANVVSEEPFFV
jgi:ribosomal protein S12 methylthiotransferase